MDSIKFFLERFPHIKKYARNIFYSIERLHNIIEDIISDISRFVKNLFLIFRLIILRGFKLFLENLFDIFKAVLRAIIDAIRWPLEYIVYPLVHKLADVTDKFIEIIQEKDIIVVGCFLLFFVYLFYSITLSFAVVSIFMTKTRHF